MILAETQYKTHNQKLLAIVKTFKTWHYYLKGCKFKVFILANHNNLRQFMDTKNLSSYQIYWAQKFSQYYFEINYYQRKANIAAHALFCFSQKSHAEEKTLRDENSQILYHLQTSLIKANIADLSFFSLALVKNLSPLHKVLICGTHVLPQLCQFWTQLWGKLAHKKPYQQASIGSLRSQLSKP